MEILFENPILWIVLLGVISSLFRGKKREEEGQKTRSNPVENRPTPKSGSAFGELKEIFREVNRTFQEETKPTQTLKKERVQEVIEPASYTQMADQGNTAFAQEIEVVQKAPISQKKNQLKVDESKLVDAVIWSEILGPPRAKNPYFGKNAQRK